jgi:hypothetical protein
MSIQQPAAKTLVALSDVHCGDPSLRISLLMVKNFQEQALRVMFLLCIFEEWLGNDLEVFEEAVEISGDVLDHVWGCRGRALGFWGAFGGALGIFWGLFGGILWLVSATSGTTDAYHQIDAPIAPRWLSEVRFRRISIGRSQIQHRVF